jgi:hypothetical protein
MAGSAPNSTPTTPVQPLEQLGTPLVWSIVAVSATVRLHVSSIEIAEIVIHEIRQ